MDGQYYGQRFSFTWNIANDVPVFAFGKGDDTRKAVLKRRMSHAEGAIGAGRLSHAGGAIDTGRLSHAEGAEDAEEVLG